MTVWQTLGLWGVGSVVAAALVCALFKAGERVSDKFQKYQDDDDDHPHYGSFR